MRIVPPSEEQLRQQVSEARQLSIAAPILIPMLERRKYMAYQRLLGNHRDSRPVDHNAIAEMFVIESIQEEIRQKLENLNLNKE
jgi:hypothetical protein